MSEPTIKPVAWMCGRCHNDVAMSQSELGCVNCHYRRRNDPTPDAPLYTHDALVAVALTTMCEQSAVFDGESERIANAIVERLTRGKP